MKRSQIRRHSGLVLPLVGALALGFSTAALACTTDPECDNGDTCSVADVCDAGSCILGGGGDVNSDLICDGEFDPAADFTSTKTIIRTRPNGGPNSAIIRGAGDFIDDAASGPFSIDDGITIRVKDQLSEVPPPGDGADLSLTFAAADCIPIAVGTLCRIETGTNRGSFVKFIRGSLAPEQVRVSYRLKGLDLVTPFFGPVRVIMTHDTITHRAGHITDCRLIPTGIKCRQF
jgi:hypothetical protein